MDESESRKLDNTQKVEELISDDGIVMESVTAENSESVNQTLDGDKSTPDNSNSNVVISDEVEDVEGVLESVIETEPSIVSANPVVLLSEELAQVAQDPIENSGASDVIEVESKEIVEKIIVLSDEYSGVSVVVEEAKVNGRELVLDENNGVSPSVMDLDKNEISPIVTNSVSKGIEDTMLPTSDGNAGESAAAVDSVLKENVANMLQAADVPDVDGGEDCNTRELPNSTENQPFITVTPSPLQRTSWRGCCGLFEVLNRSNQ